MAETSDIGNRIRTIRKSHSMTQKEFAASLGIVQSFLCAIETGKKRPSNTLLIALHHKYNIDGSWLKVDEDAAINNRQFASPSSVLNCEIPLFKTPPVDLDSFDTSQIISKISMPGLLAGSFAFEFSGDFMSPTIRDGDIVIVQPGIQPVSGDILLIVGKWGEAYLRRYRVKGDDFYFSADNSSYAPFKGDKSISVIGSVHTVWRKIKT